VRCLAGAGGLAIGLALALLIAMQMYPPVDLPDPRSTPLSNYALTSEGGLFAAAILLLVTGILGVAGAMALDDAAAIGILPLIGLGVCGVGLMAVVAFPFDKTPTGQPTTTGWVHIAASGLAFIGPPLSTLLLARRHRPAKGCSRLPQIASWLAATAPGWLAVALLTSAFGPASEMPAWRLGGVFERDLAAADIVAALILTTWTWRGCSCRARTLSRRQRCGSVG